jgi:S-methylmethionine-dependent homocysteine/selenocysteine methylase
MPKYRTALPQLCNKTFLTDGGLETVFVFQHEIDLPQFASFVLLDKSSTYKLLKEYYQDYISIAKQYHVGYVLESPTWRASSKWGDLLDYSDNEIKTINQKAIQLMTELRDEHETDKTPIVISCCIGPYGDGYVIDEMMTAKQSEDYHSTQIKTIANTEADMITAMTLSYTNEAIGILKAAQASNIPAVIGFTVETDGKLPSGMTVKDAIETVDKATNNYASYYLINCAHPTHFQKVLNVDDTWKKRIKAIRANASTKSHAELDECTELDDGNPNELGTQHLELRKQLTNLNIFGGCCGTDYRHVEAICKAVIE